MGERIGCSEELDVAGSVFIVIMNIEAILA
jgi:hypothetical protein